MMNKKAVGKTSVLLIIVAFIISVGDPGGKSVGDYIFNRMGISAWSQGMTRLHYPALLALALLLAGFLGIKLAHGRIDPKYFIALIFLSALYPSLFSYAKDFVLSQSKGLQAIEYVKRDSTVKYEVHRGEKVVKFSASVKLINHGKNDFDCFVDLGPSEQFIRDQLKENHNISLREFQYSGSSQFFIINHNSSTIGISFEGYMDEPSQLTGSGSVTAPALILKNDSQQVVFSGDIRD